VLAGTFLLGLDQVGAGGGASALFIDTLAQRLVSDYRRRVVRHEAGHFLIAYLVGLAPLAFTLSSLEAYRRYRALNVQAGCRFADKRFNEEVSVGKLSSGQLDIFSSVALAGVSAEYVVFGQAEGGAADLAQLDSLLKVLNFSQKKADGQIRYARSMTTVL
jgi:hypothetical protein